MEIVYFHRKGGSGAVSIQESFTPIINDMAKTNKVKIFEVPCFGASPIALIKNIFFIRKHSTKSGVNHITGDIHYGILGLIGRNSVLTIHDDYAIRQCKRGRIGKLYMWMLWIYLPIKFADAVVCISPTTQKNIKKRYNSPKLTKVLTHHSISSQFCPKGKPFIKSFLTFLQIGTEPNKNLEMTFKALQGLKCKLIVLKPMNESQKRIAQELNINYENKYDLPHNAVISEYDKCDIVLFPSSYEGFGMPIMEAQAAGKPIITTNKEPMSWVAGEGAAFLDDPTNVEEYKKLILRVIDDKDYRESLIKKGLENCKRFIPSNQAEKYFEVYKEVYNSK